MVEIALLTVMAIFGYLGHRRFQRVEADLASFKASVFVAQPVAGPVQACVVKVCRFADGHMIEKHSHCGHIPVGHMTPEWAQSLHPQASLLSIVEHGHQIS